MKEILLMGFYQPNEALSRFLVSAQQEFKIPIRWAGALTPLGHTQWQSLAQPLTCLLQAGSALAPSNWALSHRGWAQPGSPISSTIFPLSWALPWAVPAPEMPL